MDIRYYRKETQGCYGIDYSIGRFDYDNPTEEGDWLCDAISINLDGDFVKIERYKYYIDEQEYEDLKSANKHDYKQAEDLLHEINSKLQYVINTFI